MNKLNSNSVRGGYAPECSKIRYDEMTLSPSAALEPLEDTCHLHSASEDRSTRAWDAQEQNALIAQGLQAVQRTMPFLFPGMMNNLDHAELESLGNDAILFALDRLQQGIITPNMFNGSVVLAFKFFAMRMRRSEARRAHRQAQAFRLHQQCTTSGNLTPTEELELKDFLESIHFSHRELMMLPLLRQKYTTSEISEKVGISPSNVWQIRHRVNNPALRPSG